VRSFLDYIIPLRGLTQIREPFGSRILRKFERLLKGIELLNEAGLAAGGVVFVNYAHADCFIQSLNRVFHFGLRVSFHAGFDSSLSPADIGARRSAVDAVALALRLVLFIPFNLRLNISQLLPPNDNSNYTKVYFTTNSRIVQPKQAGIPSIIDK